MRHSVLAVVARCGGNRRHAIRYCTSMAREYPHLKTEYKAYALALRLDIWLNKGRTSFRTKVKFTKS